MATTYTVTLDATINSPSDIADAKAVAAQTAALVANMSSALPISGVSVAVSGSTPNFAMVLTATLTAPSADTADAGATTNQIAAYVDGLVMNPPISAVSASFA
jgi:hypothetical protein